MNIPRSPQEQHQVSREDAAEALTVLRAAARWRLPAIRWDRVESSAEAVTRALAIDDGPGLRARIADLILLAPVRSVALTTAQSPPPEVSGQLASLITVLEVLNGPESAGRPAASLSLPVSIYLRDEFGHEEVEAAVEELARSTGLSITDREDPVLCSWFRRLRVGLAGVAGSPAGQEVLADVAHRTELELVKRRDAEVTGLLMANVAPLITSLHDTKDAVIRLGAVLVVKYDWTLSVHQLTTRQQLILNHSPHLLCAPEKILEALGLPSAAATAIPMDPL